MGGFYGGFGLSLSDVLQEFAKDHPIQEVTALDAYTDIFRLGDESNKRIQWYGEEAETRDLVANPLVYCKNNGAKHGQYRVLFFDTFAKELARAQQFDFSIISGLSYFGRRNLLAHASKLFAFIIDLDGLDEHKFRNFLKGCYGKYYLYPLPNYLVLSGHGAHLYYVMKEPISLYPEAKKRLRQFKYALIDKVWNGYTSTQKQQMQGLSQGFRVIGGKTKIPYYNSRVFQLNNQHWTLEQLNPYLPEAERISPSEMLSWQVHRKVQNGREIARKKWPEWYQRRVVQKMPKKSWCCNRGLYDWWIKKILEGATYGHRYFCIMCLAIFAVKCGISKEELEADAAKLQPLLDSLNSEEPFTVKDVASALRCYDEKYITFPRDTISRLSGIEVKSKRRDKGKRLPQKKHLQIAEISRTSASYANVGAPDKQQIVKDWRTAHPDGKKIECERETGLSRHTVLKWWDRPKPLRLRDGRMHLTPEQLERMIEPFCDPPEEEPMEGDASELEQGPL